MNATKIIGWLGGLTVLFLILYYYVGTSSVANSLFSGSSTLIGRLQGRDVYENLPTKYPK